MLINLRPRSILISVLFFALLGLGYPLAETGIAQAFFSHTANGSLTKNGIHLVGQSWTGPQWFHGRTRRGQPVGNRRVQSRTAFQGAHRRCTATDRRIEEGGHHADSPIS